MTDEEFYIVDTYQDKNDPEISRKWKNFTDNLKPHTPNYDYDKKYIPIRILSFDLKLKKEERITYLYLFTDIKI